MPPRLTRLSLVAGPETELRLLTPADAPALIAFNKRNRTLFGRWVPSWLSMTRSDVETRALLRKSMRQHRKSGDAALGIWHEGALAGMVTLHQVDRINRGAGVGYLLETGLQGQGIATRACRALLGHAFATLNLHRLEISCASRNRRSLALARRLGFRRAGLQRQAQRIRGRYVDVVVLDLLDQEWKRR